MNSLKVTISVVGVIIILLAIGILSTECNLAFYKRYAPKFQNVEREVFEQTKSYNEAKVQDLAKYKLEYEMNNDPNAKQALKMVIIQRFADYQSERLPGELGSFLTRMRGY